MQVTAQLRDFYDDYKRAREEAGLPLHQNRKPSDGGHDLLLRDLDCAVLNLGLKSMDLASPEAGLFYQTVRGVFVEGADAYPGAAIRMKTHVQIAVRDPSSVLGYFLPTRYDDEEEGG